MFLYINNNHILTKFQHNVKQIVFQKRTKIFQMRTISIYSNKKTTHLHRQVEKYKLNILKTMAKRF